MTDKKQQLDLSQMMGALTGALDPSKAKDFAWYRSFSYPDIPDFSLGKVMRFASASLFSHALSKGEVVYTDVKSISHTEPICLDPELEFNGFRKVVETTDCLFYVSPKSALEIRKVNRVMSMNFHVGCTVISLDKSVIETVFSEFEKAYGKVETE